MCLSLVIHLLVRDSSVGPNNKLDVCEQLQKLRVRLYPCKIDFIWPLILYTDHSKAILLWWFLLLYVLVLSFCAVSMFCKFSCFIF